MTIVSMFSLELVFVCCSYGYGGRGVSFSNSHISYDKYLVSFAYLGKTCPQSASVSYENKRRVPNAAAPIYSLVAPL